MFTWKNRFPLLIFFKKDWFFRVVYRQSWISNLSRAFSLKGMNILINKHAWAYEKSGLSLYMYN